MSGKDVERVKAALPDVDTYIHSHGQHTADLEQSGDELRGPHPVHGSSTGHNFSVNTRRNQWYCHRKGHKVGGSILEWIAVDEGIVDCENANDISGVFPKVLQVAAEKAGVNLDLGPDEHEEMKKWRERRELVDSIYDAAAKFYHSGLPTEYRDYLNDHYGLSDDTIDDAKIGFAPVGDRKLLDHLEAEGFTEDEVLKSGLAMKPSGRQPCDLFDGRLVFPYFEYGQVRYFIGRKTDDTPDEPWEQGKYRKLPRHSEKHDYVSKVVDEPVFGVDTLNGPDRVIVTEGITDAIAAHQAGYAAVAPVTTSFKKGRVDAIKRALASKKVTVIFDEDSDSQAGLKGATKTARELAQSDKITQVRVARLPAESDEDVDLCDYLKAHSVDELETVINRAVNAYTACYLWGDGEPADLFAGAMRVQSLNPHRVMKIENDDNPVVKSVWDVIDATELGEAHRQFERRQTEFDGQERQAMYQEVIYADLEGAGQFFRTATKNVYYFFDPDAKVYIVDGDGNQVISREFKSLIQDRFGINPGSWARHLLEGVLTKADYNAPEREIHTFAHYDRDDGVLYVTDFDHGYYAIEGSGEIERRRNGEDVFFRDYDAEPYTYLEPDDRPEIPDTIPGELHPLWKGNGDLIHRFLTNRINYAEDAALAPAQQRKQLYIHIHCLPFLSVMNSRPIMAWVGEKGSGKTVSQRSIGKFVFGPEYSETVLPDNKDDFLALVSNSPLSFIDNFDSGTEWANDILAAVATGAGIQKRKYYTTGDMASFNPDCWLSITSRDPPFRRDDVADRTLVFRVRRLEDGEFIGSGDYLNQVNEYRDAIWSEYLENLDAVVGEYRQTATETMSSSHRMADWAIFAHVVAEALSVEDVEGMLETMEAERAHFALENEPLAHIIQKYTNESPEDAAKWQSAKDLLEDLDETAAEMDVDLQYSAAASIGSKLVDLRHELGELCGLEIDDSGRANQYRFEVGDDATREVGLGRF